jgi:hypothetical protein
VLAPNTRPLPARWCYLSEPLSRLGLELEAGRLREDDYVDRTAAFLAACGWSDEMFEAELTRQWGISLDLCRPFSVES